MNITPKNKLRLKLVLLALLIVFLINIFGDWEHFKDGLFGRTPIESTE